MRARSWTSISAVLLACSLPAFAQLAVPVRIGSSTRQVDISSDGSSVITSHIETKILTQAGIALAAQTKLGYQEQLQDIEIKQAYTLKPDGKRFVISPDAIITQQAPSQNALTLSDSKQKVLIYPNVEVGDTLVMDTVTRAKPLMPGNYTYDSVFPAALGIENLTMTITAPKDLALQVDANNLSFTKTESGDRQSIEIKYSHPDADITVKGQPPFDIAPRISVSTFKTYDTFAKVYGDEALATAQVTPAIQAKADEITAGSKDRREQARKIYEWVSGHVRYVAVELGRGGMIPHGAETVMTNGYGDCKDHAVLFLALLKARGIAANLVLINATDGYTIAKAPTVSPFNHMIVWIPEFRLYADTTVGKFVRFGVLPLTESSKPVVHIGDKSGALHEIPPNDGSSSLVNYKQIQVSDDAGHLISNSQLSTKGAFATPVRMLGEAGQGQDPAKLAEALLKKSNTPGATGTLTLPNASSEPEAYEISSSYNTAGVIRGLAAGTPIAMRDNLRPLSPLGPSFFGPLILSASDGVPAGPCFNGHAVDDETLQYPSTHKLVKLPADSKLDSAHLSYSAHWSNDDHSITVHRELSTHFDKNICLGAPRAEMKTLADKIRDDLNLSFAITRGTDPVAQ